MTEFKQAAPILAAVDFSPCSEDALKWAGHLALRLGAPLVALHVVHDPGSAPGYYARTKKSERHLVRIEAAAAEMMKTFLDRLRSENPELLAKVTSQMVVGLPVTRILEVAEHLGAQLIVMGSHGRTGLEHALLGSKAEKVVQLSPIPVTIVKRSAAVRHG